MHHYADNAVAPISDVRLPTVTGIKQAVSRLASVVSHTPLQVSCNLSAGYNAEISLKREDLQIIRSFKIRGAYNKISQLSLYERKKGVVCASAGNHSQGVAYACAALQIKAKIFMPATTPPHKVNRTCHYGQHFVDVVLIGSTFDEAYAEAIAYQLNHQATMIHPFNDVDIIEGQGTVALEILKDAQRKIDYLFVPVGGGGLASGIATYFKACSPETILVGVEPAGAASMKASFEAGKNIGLATIDGFVDGAAVKLSGDLGYHICREKLDYLVSVPEGKACATLLDLYSKEAMVVEPAGTLSIAALDLFAEQIQGKHVVCIVSGGNNDSGRMGEIKARALQYQHLSYQQE